MQTETETETKTKNNEIFVVFHKAQNVLILFKVRQMLLTKT